MTEKTPVPAAECTDMAQVRAAIDGLDRLIVSLMAALMCYIDAAARIKSSRDTVRDEVRKAAVIAHAVKVADDRGFRRSSPIGSTTCWSRDRTRTNSKYSTPRVGYALTQPLILRRGPSEGK